MNFLCAAALASGLALAACTSEAPRYLVGTPYQMGGVWSYPREETGYRDTGLATRAPAAPFARTANGERTGGISAQHRTLQLPSVVRVTNLENGRSMLVRVNDRGPAQRGRLIGLSPRASDLLGIGATTQVRVELDAERSAAAAGRAPGRPDPAGEITAAPRAAVASEDLAPPSGARAATPAAARPARAESTAPDLAPPAETPLPEDVTSGAPAPGRLFVEAGSFSGRAAAQRQAARLASLGARVEGFQGGELSFRVRIGPLPGVAQADSALERTLALGVSGARILVD